MSQNKKIDYPFLIVLLFVISIGGYWIFKGIQSQNLNPYLDYLETRLMTLAPQNAAEKDKVQTLYEEFKVNVQENKIDPDDVEEVAAEILNLSNKKDTISVQRAEELLAATIPPPPDKIIPQPEETRLKWRELNEKLKNIYDFEERLREQRLEERFIYQFDKDLQIIADRKGIKDLIEADAAELAVTLENLEKEKILIWTEDIEQDIQRGLDSAIIVIESMRDSVNVNRLRIETQLKEHRARPDSGRSEKIRTSKRARVRSKD